MLWYHGYWYDYDSMKIYYIYIIAIKLYTYDIYYDFAIWCHQMIVTLKFTIIMHI